MFQVSNNFRKIYLAGNLGHMWSITAHSIVAVVRRELEARVEHVDFFVKLVLASIVLSCKINFPVFLMTKKAVELKKYLILRTESNFVFKCRKKFLIWKIVTSTLHIRDHYYFA